MEEHQKQTAPAPAPENPWSAYDPPAKPPHADWFSTEKREVIFGIAILVLGLGLANFFFFGGMNLGFAAALLCSLAAAVCYLRASGFRGNWYCRTVLVLCALIIPGFARTDDGFVKFVMGIFLFVGINLGLTSLAGKNRWDPSTIGSLLDPFRSFFGLGFGKLPESFRGIRRAFTDGSAAAKKTGSVLLGAVIAVPILAVMIPLLMRADAAFEGLLDLLPEFEFSEFFVTAVFGGGGACILYTRTVALKHTSKSISAAGSTRKGLSTLTMNTALFAVCALYVVYLLSQLAYFVGGFSGILPEGYSLAEYARRGFFEMAWLCAINLSVMVLGISVTEKRQGKTPLSIRLACLFLGLVTLFFVFAAGAKMVLYIGAYGMTRLRVLTMVIMGFLGLTTAVVSVWLFLPKLPYMKIVVIAALVIGGAVLWTDVDTVVAKYNVEAYLSGGLESVDVNHLSNLGSGAVPYIDQLAKEAPDDFIRVYAQNVLNGWYNGEMDDFRQWNYTDWVADPLLPEQVDDVVQDVAPEVTEVPSLPEDQN